MRNWKENDTKMRLLASTTIQTFNHTEGKEKWGEIENYNKK